MGGDGGCHPNGRQFMQGTITKTKEERELETPTAIRELNFIRTRTCSLTNVSLDLGVPVVADELGNLFTKEAMLTALIEKKIPAEFEHVRGMKDVAECVFSPNPDGCAAELTDDAWSPYSCPIANVEMNGRLPFVLLRGSPAGRVNVISGKAYKEIGHAALQDEYGPFLPANVIKLVPNDEDRAAMIKVLSTRREDERRAKADKKADKKRKTADDGGAVTEEAGEVALMRKSKTPAAASEATNKAQKSATCDSRQSKVFVGEAAKSLATQMKSDPLYKGLFHGAGSQKPKSATHQFIVEGGRRGLV
jgi:hypothetical protein